MDYQAFQVWKSSLRQLAESMQAAFNSRMVLFDRKKPSAKASGVRNRFIRCPNIFSNEFEVMMRRYALLKVNCEVQDRVTPDVFQKEGGRLEKYFFAVAQSRLNVGADIEVEY